MKKVLLSLVAAIVATVAIAQTEPELQLRPMQEAEILPSHSVAVSTLEPQPEYKMKNWRIAVDVAYSRRIAKLVENTTGVFTDSEWQEFGKEIRNGIAYGVSITGFFNTSAGLGGKFVMNRYSANVRGISDAVNTYYIAPEFVGRVPTRNNKNVWIFTVSAGYVSYNEKIEMLSYSKGGFKSTLEAGFDIRLGRDVFLGFKLAATSGTINFKVDGKNYKESLNAIELGGGLRF